MERKSINNSAHVFFQTRQLAAEPSSPSSPSPDSGDAPSVKIHNIRSSLPEPEIEMIYTVYKGRKNAKCPFVHS